MLGTADRSFPARRVSNRRCIRVNYAGLANHDRMVSIVIIRSLRRRRGRAETLRIVAAGRTAGYLGTVTRWAGRWFGQSLGDRILCAIAL
jgi:hypothetical protein